MNPFEIDRFGTAPRCKLLRHVWHTLNPSTDSKWPASNSTLPAASVIGFRSLKNHSRSHTLHAKPNSFSRNRLLNSRSALSKFGSSGVEQDGCISVLFN